MDKLNLYLIAILVVLSLGLFLSLTHTLYKKEANNKTVKNFAFHARGLPIRLKIPTLDIDAKIEQVGVISNGEMGVPLSTANVGWFNLGPHPGEKGSAVIAGHVDDEDGEAAVFADLYKLKKGDKLYIKDDKGASITFIVREKRMYEPGYADEVFSLNGSSHLNLITCDGIWDIGKKSYSKRLVVFADIMHQP